GYGHHSPKYLHFLSMYIATVAAIGNFVAEEYLQKKLTESVASVDVVANSVREESAFQELYRLARMQSIDRLKETASRDPSFFKQPHNRIISTYFAILGGDFALAENYFTSDVTSPTDSQFQSYEIMLKSFFKATHQDYAGSIALAKDALLAI